LPLPGKAIATSSSKPIVEATPPDYSPACCKPRTNRQIFQPVFGITREKTSAGCQFISQARFLSFDTLDGGVFLHCGELDCVVLEGGDRALFVEINKQVGLGAIPEPEQNQALG